MAEVSLGLDSNPQTELSRIGKCGLKEGNSPSPESAGALLHVEVVPRDVV